MAFDNSQRGAVALFIVIFSALLITTITVTFVRIMIQSQQQAVSNDLSASAMDSALAGVEDAKRAIVMYRTYCANGGAGQGSPECQQLATALQDGTNCSTLQDAGIVQGDDEVEIKQTEDDRALSQAYTCVKVELDTEDYVGSVTPNTSRLVPLFATGEIDRVKLEWYSQNDLQELAEGNDSQNNASLSLTSEESLPKLSIEENSGKTEWPINRPGLMRIQLIQFADSFNLSYFDSYDEEEDQTNNATLFLMPSTISEDPDGTVDFLVNARRSKDADILRRVKCNENFSAASSEQYACSVILLLPKPIGYEADSTHTAYLRVNTLYNSGTSFKLSLFDQSDNKVDFKSVQPIVDSTGRANDLFRRVKSRVELESSSIPGIEAAVDISGSLCKSFTVTDTDYNPGGCRDVTTP